MSYQLGIDFGTTFTAAAVRRPDEDQPEVVPLGGHEGAVSSVLHLARDGRVTVGEAAAGLAGIDPTRVVRALKRRVGDPEPIVVGGRRWDAEELTARLLRWVVDRASEHEAGPPARIALAHPPSWAAHTLERLAAALAGQDLAVTFVAEPRAVAHAAAGSTAPGGTVGIHDLGGGRFDAAVLRREGPPAGGFTMLGVPEAITDLGGLDLDDLVWQHVRAALPDDVAPVARVRRACTRAKEALSVEDEVVVRIRRGELRGAVRLERATFEGLIAPQVDRTATALRRTITSAGLEPGQLAVLLLVGGSARIPLVARRVTELLGRTPTVHTAADLIARGAVLALAAPSAAVEPGARVSTASGYLATGPTTEPSEGGVEAPTVKLAVPAGVDAPTTRFAARSVVRQVDEDSADEDSAPAAEAPAAEAPAAEAPVAEAPVAEAPAAEAPAAEAPAAEAPASQAPDPDATVRTTAAAPTAPVDAPQAVSERPAPRRGPGRTRPAAVLDPAARRTGRPSLARTLVGVGALIVAVLVLVALFRPDGPLDPPLDPVAGDGATHASVPPPAAAVPPARASIPPVAEVRTGPAADLRPSVTTTPPAVPRAASGDVPSAARGVRTEGPRTAMTPPTPVPLV